MHVCQTEDNIKLKRTLHFLRFVSINSTCDVISILFAEFNPYYFYILEIEMVFFGPFVSIFLKTVVDNSSFKIRKLQGSFKLTLVNCSVILCLSLISSFYYNGCWLFLSNSKFMRGFWKCEQWARDLFTSKWSFVMDWKHYIHVNFKWAQAFHIFLVSLILILTFSGKRERERMKVFKRKYDYS